MRSSDSASITGGVDTVWHRRGVNSVYNVPTCAFWNAEAGTGRGWSNTSEQIPDFSRSEYARGYAVKITAMHVCYAICV